MSENRAAPLYCPYCGEEDLRPHDGSARSEGSEPRSRDQASPASHGAWECHACARVFTVKFVGLLTRAVDR
jgi:transposase-like protein